VTWPDVQQIFQEALLEASGLHSWNENMDDKYPVLSSHTALQNKVETSKIKQLIEGEWRLYSIPVNKRGDTSAGFSYGILISEYDAEKKTFLARSGVEGRYRSPQPRRTVAHCNPKPTAGTRSRRGTSQSRVTVWSGFDTPRSGRMGAKTGFRAS